MTNRPLRIVHAYNWMHPSNGGPPRVLAGLVGGQQQLGHDIRLISSDPPDDPEVEAFYAQFLDPIPPRTVVRPKFWLPIWHFKRLKATLEGADIVHLHAIWPPATLLTSQMCRLMGIPYVLTPHGSLHSAALNQKRPRKFFGMWGLGYGAMVKNAAVIHALNDEEADGASWITLPDRVEVIPNGIFPEEFANFPEPGAFRQTVPGLGDAPFVLFLSRMHWSKGCDLLGAAFAQVAAERPDVHLVVAGYDQGGRAMLEDAARQHGFSDRLHLVGPILAPLKYAAFRDAAVYCLPSRHEGFSIAITEALAWGRPVVITRECHFPEVATEGCGHVVDLTPQAIGDGLLDLLSDPARAEAMGARGRALVMTHYTWPTIAERMVDLYRSVL